MKIIDRLVSKSMSMLIPNFSESRRNFFRTGGFSLAYLLLMLSSCTQEREQKSIISMSEAENQLRKAFNFSPLNLLGYVAPLYLKRGAGNFNYQNESDFQNLNNLSDTEGILLMGTVLSQVPADSSPASLYRSHVETLLTPDEFMKINGYTSFIDEDTYARSLAINRNVLNFIVNGSPEISDMKKWTVINSSQGMSSNFNDILLKFSRNGIADASDLTLTHFASDTWHTKTNISHQLRHILVVKDAVDGSSYVIKVQPIEIAMSEAEGLNSVSGYSKIAARVTYQPNTAEKISVTISKVLTLNGEMAPTLSSFIENGNTLSPEHFSDLDNILYESLQSYMSDGKLPKDLFQMDPHNIVVADDGLNVIETDLRVAGGKLLFDRRNNKLVGTGEVNSFLENARRLYIKLGKNDLPTFTERPSTHIITTLDDVANVEISVIDGAVQSTKKIPLIKEDILNPLTTVTIPRNMSTMAFSLFSKAMTLFAVGSLSIEFANETLSADEKVYANEMGITAGVRPFTTVKDHLDATTSFAPNVKAFYTYQVGVRDVESATRLHNSIVDLRESLSLAPGNRELTFYIKEIPNDDKNQSPSEGIRLPILFSGSELNHIKISYLQPIIDLQNNVQLYPVVRDFSNSIPISMDNFNIIDNFLSKLFDNPGELSILEELDDLTTRKVIIGYTIDYEGNLMMMANVDRNFTLRYVARFSRNSSDISLVSIMNKDLIN